jgi:hypothetical protein
MHVCVIGICAAAAIERATSKAAAEYTAATAALKYETGYKEMFQNTFEAPSPGNQKVSVQIGTANVETVLDNVLLGTGSFLSGIPFFFATAPASPVITNNMVKFNEKTWYIPFNTISNACSVSTASDPNVKNYMTCMLSNKSGPQVLKIFFLELNNQNDFMSKMKVNNLASDISSKKQARGSFISKKFGDVGTGVYYVMTFQQKIAQVRQTDAETLAAKKASIEKLKKQIAELTAKLVLLQKQKTTLSSELQTVQTTKSETFNKRQKKITYRISLEATIKTLEGSISPASQITALETTIATALKELEYWLQGSIYHRVINTTEKAGLLAMKNDNSQFEAKINDYFFPQ